MATKIQLRRDTLSNWTKADPVIMEGEIVLVSENADNPVYDRFKIGNGVNKFSELPFYQEKEEKRYLFKLDLIDRLTTATDSKTAYQSFIPVGETVYKLPTTGDLLGNEESNIYADILYAHYTEAMDEGGITLSYCKDGVVKTIRITGDDYEFGTWKVAEVTTVKLKYKYDLRKIFALSPSSGTKDIEEALTPTYAPDGNTAMRLPQSGDLLQTGGATSVVLKGMSRSFSFFYGANCRDITLSGSAGNYKVAVVVTPLNVRVFDLDKLNALTDKSSSKDIEDALVNGATPVPGDLLQGADSYATVLCSNDNLSRMTSSFSYITGGKRRTITFDESGGQGNMTIKKVTEDVLVPAPKTSYNKIAHLVFDLQLFDDNDVQLTLDKLNSYWLESIGNSYDLNLRYEGGGTHGMPILDIVYSKINTDVNNDKALWQKAFTDNNIVFTNCAIPYDQKIKTKVDLSAGKVAELTIDFSNIEAMTPFKEDNAKIFVEIYEPVK